ncbi:hypothetical protein GF377_08140 [candidate division GN15 bacterium]|nr:hypothetical protein [candidate division GN15 bacterium]
MIKMGRSTMSDRSRVIKDVLWFFAFAGLTAAIFRLWFGLGATTNLTDAFPWGLWKILNMVGGVALSTSGFTVGLLVYVLGLERFRPFVKPAILIAFLGYGCSCLALMFDIGLPHRFWHPILMWNINSFLFEVFWCVLLYFTVTAIELAPVFLEKLRAEKAVRFLHKVATAVVIIGISLSSLHHSSLGSLFLVTPTRLHALWYSPWLPLLFIVSAMGAGIMVVVLAKLLWSYRYEPAAILGPTAQKPTPVIKIVNGSLSAGFKHGPEGPEMPRIRALATIAAGLLGVFLLLKIIDFSIHGGWDALFAGTWESWLLLVETGLLAGLPIVLMVLRATRRTPAGIAVAAGSAAVGLALNRVDVGIFGYFADAGTTYFPSLIEWAVGLGVIAVAGLAFFFVAEHFPIFSPTPPAVQPKGGLFRLSFGSLRQLWKTVLTDGLHRVSLIAVFGIPLAFVLMYPPYYANPGTEQVRPAEGLNAERTVLRIDGDHAGVETRFAHVEHQQRLGDSASCVKCHHVALPNDRSTACSRCHQKMNTSTMIFDHVQHAVFVAEQEHLGGMRPANKSCMVCHADNSPKTAANAKDCMACHRDDMFLLGLTAGTTALCRANAFREAMHGTCIECHQQQAVAVNKPKLADCRTCHESLRARQTSDQNLAIKVD